MQHRIALGGFDIAVHAHHFHEQRGGRDLDGMAIRTGLAGGAYVLVEEVADCLEHVSTLRN